MKKLLLGLLALSAHAQKLPGVSSISKTACPTSHPVKGNIVDRGARKGERVYHTPQSRSYKATYPERCFKSVQEAQQAGYKAPRK